MDGGSAAALSTDEVTRLSLWCRGGGLGLVLASAGFGMLTAPIMELHNQKGYFLHHIIFACCTLICIICILLLPETRYQPLPETLADGENYTRQPLLPPRKPGEQRLLLVQSESSRDYTRVHDTPLHEAAATAVSTMDSTASSAMDLAALSVADCKPEPKDPNGRSVSSTSLKSVAAGKGDVVRASKERLLSSTPLRTAPSVTDPLLANAENPLTHSVVPEINDTGPVNNSDAETDLPPPPEPSAPPAPHIVPASLLICTTPIIEPPPSSMLESPNQPANDVEHVAVTAAPPSPPPADSTSPCLHATLPPSPAPVPDPQPPSTTSPIHLELLDDSAPHPQPLESTSPCENDLSPPSSPHASPVPVPPSPTPPPPIAVDHTPSANSSAPAVVDAVGTAAPVVLPITDIVHPPTTDVAPPAQDSAAPSSSMDSTPPLAVDTGVLAIRDSPSTDAVDGTS